MSAHTGLFYLLLVASLALAIIVPSVVTTTFLAKAIQTIAL